MAPLGEDSVYGALAKDFVYGGEYSWVNVPYRLQVDYGVSPMQWVQGVLKVMLSIGDIAFKSDGTFCSPMSGEALFPVGGTDLKWRYDSMRQLVVIDFFSDESLIEWRWDELLPTEDPLVEFKCAPDLVGLGYVWPFSFSYSFIRSSTYKNMTKCLQSMADDDVSAECDIVQAGARVSQQTAPDIGQEPAALKTGSGYLGYLTEEQSGQLKELERRLVAEPAPRITAHAREGETRRVLRFLRGDKFNVDKAFARIHENAKWWSAYGMDDFTAEDEFDENGPCFVCGKDRWGRPTLICRPCVHFSSSEQASHQAVRRAIFTVQRCVERLPPGLERFTLIYDVSGVQMANMDYTFARELIKILERHYPERMDRVVVINCSWLVATLWAIVSPLLDPVTRDKIIFLTSYFHDGLLDFVKEDHPYLQYADEVAKRWSSEVGEVALPKASAYEPRWEDSVAADTRHLVANSACSCTPQSRKPLASCCKQHLLQTALVANSARSSVTGGCC